MRLRTVVVALVVCCTGFSIGCERQPIGRPDRGAQDAVNAQETRPSTLARQAGSVGSRPAKSACVKEVECFSGIAADRCPVLRSVIVSAAQARIGSEPSLCETFAGSDLTFKIYDKFVDVSVDASAAVLNRLGLGALAVDWDDKVSAFTLRSERPLAPVVAGHAFLSIAAPNLTEKGMKQFEINGRVFLEIKIASAAIKFAVDRSGSYELLLVRSPATDQEEYSQAVAHELITKARLAK